MSPITGKPWTPEDDSKLRELFDSGMVDSAIAEQLDRTVAATARRRQRLGIAVDPYATVKRVTEQYKRWVSGERHTNDLNESTAQIGDEDTFSKGEWTTVRTSERPLSEEEFLKEFKIDTERWELVQLKCKAGRHEGFMRKPDRSGFTIVPQVAWRVECRLRLRVQHIRDKAAVDVYLELCEDRTPSKPEWGTPVDGCEYEALCSVADHHLGKLAWREETGADYDLGIASDLWRKAFSDLLSRIRVHGTTRTVLVFGNDFLNADSSANTTTAGTPQDCDSRYPKIFRRGLDLLVWATEQAAYLGPVKVIIVVGNHDQQSVYSLGVALEAWFRQDDRIQIDALANTRKYHRFGETMFCLTHGDKAKVKQLPGIMASEMRQMWGETRFKEAHTGHYHTAGLVEMNGVYLRTSPSLCAADAWHHDSGFVGNLRRAEAYLYHKTRGLEAQFTHTIDG